ncbi:MAG TPA: DUF2628 domain-containing protein [Pseudolabrys sp.]|nr:DUF2628 domain-containing protein [Pseudolabrys sp.]
MAVYTVHEPPPRKGEAVAAPERFMFVRDGFYFWAFLLTPLWMLVHRLWLVLVLYVGGMILLGIGMAVAQMPLGARALVFLLIAILIGIEAASLRRWTLSRRRWKQVGVVVGDDLEAAERRFFAGWVERRPPQAPVAAAPAASPAPRVASPTPSDVIGWAPDAGSMP